MKYNINCIYNYYDTLLSEWSEWNKELLVGSFTDDASNLSEALGISSSDGRSRAKELYRIGLLTHELTKGMEALNSAKRGENLQSRLGFISALLYQGYEKTKKDSIFKSIAALNAIYSLAQPFEIEGFSLSVNTVIHRLLETFPLQDGYDRTQWIRYLLSGFCCELKMAKDSKAILDYLKGNDRGISLRIIENKSDIVRCTIYDTDSLKKAIDDKVSLTNIYHQKLALFLLGSSKDDEPRGFYGVADKYFQGFLQEAFYVESFDIENSPFKNLYIDDECQDCQKSQLLEVLKNICISNPDFAKEYKNIMKTIEEGAIEALMYITDKPKSAFEKIWIPKDSVISVNDYVSYLAALRTKPFLLLAGISGTGKSQKVQELAYMSCPKGKLREENETTPGNYCLVEVKPNWHDSTELLGYYSALSGCYELTDFIRFAYKALMNPDVPFFLCLDEMNLAPVEQYFAEFLSVLETRKRIVDGDKVKIHTQPLLTKDKFSNCSLYKYIRLNENDNTPTGVEHIKTERLYSEKDSEIIEYLKENGLTLPDNLFVIGTVNMDDTTHQFSRKVIDRAFTIEMNGGKMEEMFSAESRAVLEYREEPIPLSAFKSEFVRAYEVLEDDRFAKYAETITSRIPELLGNSDGTSDENSINGILKSTPFRVSYRVQNELVLYLSVLIENAEFPDDIEPLIGEATLVILMEKVLPRIQGEQKQLETKGGKSNVLKDMRTFVETHFTLSDETVPEIYNKVIKKLDEMDGKLSGYYTNFF